MNMIAVTLSSAAILTILTGPAQAAPAVWRPGDANKPATCEVLWKAIGLPTYSARRNATLVCHGRFVLSHNNAARSPDWVIEVLQKAKLTNTESRPDKSFVQETLVPPLARAKDEDYQNTRAKFARGHMAPSEDFNNSEDDMKSSFVLSNAVPQVGARFNGSVWKRLEEEVRSAALRRGEVYVITGPVRRFKTSRTRTIAKPRSCGAEIVLTGPADGRICQAHNKNPLLCKAAGVAVPIAVYKIVYDPEQGTAHAFVMPNRDHDSQTGDAGQTYLEGFRVKVAAIERITGLRFFAALPAAQRKAVRQRCADKPLWD
jgi:endonuclease G